MGHGTPNEEEKAHHEKRLRYTTELTAPMMTEATRSREKTQQGAGDPWTFSSLLASSICSCNQFV